jgi:hypothetical protein
MRHQQRFKDIILVFERGLGVDCVTAFGSIVGGEKSSQIESLSHEFMVRKLRTASSFLSSGFAARIGEWPGPKQNQPF